MYVNYAGGWAAGLVSSHSIVLNANDLSCKNTVKYRITRIYIYNFLFFLKTFIYLKFIII